jgi:hypothetical protein
MDGDFRLDIEDVAKKVNTSEVLLIYFPLLRMTLLVDTRFNENCSPLVAVMPMASSIEDRFRSLRKLRPYLGRPKGVSLVAWTRYAESLVRLGIWDMLIQRFVDSGHRDTILECEEALEEIYTLELEEISSVITGDNYHTLWSRDR